MRQFAPRPDRIEQRQRERALFEHYALLHQHQTPKPEAMFRTPIQQGLCRIVRRRGKPPLLQFNRYV
jgi:hypothetical protein